MATDQLSSHQAQVAKSILAAINEKDETTLSLSGSAGTGKSFVAIEIAKRFKGKVHLSATTNKAAKVLDTLFNNTLAHKATTVHSFLGLKLEWSEGRQTLVRDASKNIETDLLIIDEASMVNNELYLHIQRGLMAGRFKHVLFVGDPYQLPPVKENFLPLLLNTPNSLEEVVRQQIGNPIIEQATQIRELIRNKERTPYKFKPIGSQIKLFRSRKSWLEDYLANPSTSKHIISFANSVVDKINKEVRTALKPDFEEYESGDVLISQEVLEKDGIICVNNGEELLIVEAEMQDEFWFLTDSNNRSFYVPTAAHKPILKQRLDDLYKAKLWLDYISLRRSFLDVKYEYASTYHKSQGSTWECVYMDASWFPPDIEPVMLNRLIYVGLTRASESVAVLV